MNARKLVREDGRCMVAVRPEAGFEMREVC